MFEIRCIVGDKKVPIALRALRGHTLEPPVAVALDEDQAASADQSTKQQTETNGAVAPKKRHMPHGGKHLHGQGATAIVRDLIASSGVSKISSREMKKAVVAKGYSKGSYTNPIKILIKEGVLKPTKTLGDYEVTR